MNSVKLPFVYLVLFLIVVSITPSIVFCDDKLGEKYKPNDALIQASFKKAKKLGYNAIPMYVEKEGGNSIITGGPMISFRNGRVTCVENDMVINVGEFPLTVNDLKLLKGEFAVVKDGEFVKNTEKITSD
jgi:hypothetical protein